MYTNWYSLNVYHRCSFTRPLKSAVHGSSEAGNKTVVILPRFRMHVCSFSNETVCILKQTSLKYDRRDPLGNKTTLWTNVDPFSTTPLTDILLTYDILNGSYEPNVLIVDSRYIYFSLGKCILWCCQQNGGRFDRVWNMRNHISWPQFSNS